MKKEVYKSNIDAPIYGEYNRGICKICTHFKGIPRGDMDMFLYCDQYPDGKTPSQYFGQSVKTEREKCPYLEYTEEGKEYLIGRGLSIELEKPLK